MSFIEDDAQWTCNLCPAAPPLDSRNMFDHFRLFHPSALIKSLSEVEQWPDGEPMMHEEIPDDLGNLDWDLYWKHVQDPPCERRVPSFLQLHSRVFERSSDRHGAKGCCPVL